ncbi:MAG: hypothetical protein Q7J42_02090 [Sulfuritalea sp.]|nr:hypothetical protein [Sulfuritalea sp.]
MTVAAAAIVGDSIGYELGRHREALHKAEKPPPAPVTRSKPRPKLLEFSTLKP